MKTIIRMIYSDGTVKEANSWLLDGPTNLIIFEHGDGRDYFTYASMVEEGQGEDRHRVLIYREPSVAYIYDDQLLGEDNG